MAGLSKRKLLLYRVPKLPGIVLPLIGNIQPGCVCRCIELIRPPDFALVGELICAAQHLAGVSLMRPDGDALSSSSLNSRCIWTP